MLKVIIYVHVDEIDYNSNPYETQIVYTTSLDIYIRSNKRFTYESYEIIDTPWPIINQIHKISLTEVQYR